MSRVKGSEKSGGRVKGSLDRQQRQLVSGELAYSILATFELLGGTQAMLEWSRANQTVFYTQILPRLFPAPQKEDVDGATFNTQINFPGSLNPDVEAARRIAYALAKGMIQSEDPDAIAQAACRLERPEPRWPDPPTYDAPSFTPEEVARMAATAEHQRTEEAQVYGSAREQGRIKDTPTVQPARVPVRLRGKGRSLI